MNENYVDLSLFFREEIKFDKEIQYDEFNDLFVEKVIITPGKQKILEASMRIELSSKFCKKHTKEEILMKLDDFILEFLLKFSLDLQVLFPFYKKNMISISNEKEIHDYIETHDKLIILKKIFKNSDINQQNINFIKHREKYLKMIRILSLVESDPIVVYLILYDWFLEWLTPTEKRKKQDYLVQYISNNIEELSSVGFRGLIEKEHWLLNQGKKNEDIFTKIRNDISHSAERIEEEKTKNLSGTAKLLIIPLIFTMTYYLKNNEN